MKKLRGRQAFGSTAETAAEQYLRRKGYRILGRNIRSPIGELDLVAETGPFLVFVEVKARRSTALGGPAYAVDRRKQNRLIRLAAQYRAQHQAHDRPCRFDVLLYHGGPGEGASIEHVENAFEVSGDDLRW